jgi:hypothetical protein
MIYYKIYLQMLLALKDLELDWALPTALQLFPVMELLASFGGTLLSINFHNKFFITIFKCNHRVHVYTTKSQNKMRAKFLGTVNLYLIFGN